jgi:hypothetical protein
MFLSSVGLKIKYLHQFDESGDFSSNILALLGQTA